MFLNCAKDMIDTFVEPNPSPQIMFFGDVFGMKDAKLIFQSFN